MPKVGSSKHLSSSPDDFSKNSTKVPIVQNQFFINYKLSGNEFNYYNKPPPADYDHVVQQPHQIQQDSHSVTEESSRFNVMIANNSFEAPPSDQQLMQIRESADAVGGFHAPSQSRTRGNGGHTTNDSKIPNYAKPLQGHSGKGAASGAQTIDQSRSNKTPTASVKPPMRP